VTRYATSFRELEPALRGSLPRALARSAALAALRADPRSPRPGVRIVHYHYVFQDQRDGFARQLELFRQEYAPVSLTEAVGRLRSGGVEGRELAVTFDDGFRNQLEHAVPLLADAGITACFFLVTDLVGAAGAVAETFCRDRLHLPAAVEPLSWDEAAELVRLGHEVGSHTRSHPNLAALDPDGLREELQGSRDELERRLGAPVAHFSAPYGDQARFSAAVPAAACEAGYESCLSAQRGRNEPGADLYALRRDHLIAGWPVSEARTFLRRG
jgi:peptidoglycan/xylan/chitin deacetylase (PgdA/CDA1 family)